MVEQYERTPENTVWLNPRGVCGNCGLVGAYDFKKIGFRCQVCLSYEVTELLEAAQEVLAEFSEWNLDSTPLRRLDLAVKEVQGLGRR